MDADAKRTADDAALRRRLEKLGLALDEGERDESATITPRTLARGASPAEDATIRDPLMTEGIDLESLPRMATKDLAEVGVLGAGGMGRVVLARQASLSRDVAVKTLHANAAAVDLAALVREARVAGSLEHPSIIPVHALGVNERGEPLLVMKRVEGVSWRTLLDDPDHAAWKTHLGGDRDRLDANLDILVSVCRALELAHARGILHRDVKPENVMIGAYGEVYLVDWGIATTPGPAPDEDLVLGTPGYMAPEMALCEPIDERTDVYLLGATLHRALTHAPRHQGKRTDQRIIAAAHSLPATYGPDVPAPLGDLCNAACAKEPEDRPASVRAFRERLVAFKRHRSAIAICDVAESRLRALMDALAGAPEGAAPPDLATAYRVAAEARFGFAQSLAQFPEHDDARRGQQRCIEAMVDLELRQDHVDTAAALLEEAAPAPPELAERVAAARERATERAREEGRLRALDRAHDPRVGRRGRVTVMAGMLITNFGIWAFVFATHGVSIVPSARTLPYYMLVVIGITAIGALTMRKELLSSSFNRRLGVVVVSAELAMLANRTTAALLDSPVPHSLATDLLILALAAAIGASFVSRIAVAIPIVLAGYVAIEARPDLVRLFFIPSVLLALTGVLWAVYAGGPPREDSK